MYSWVNTSLSIPYSGSYCSLHLIWNPCGHGERVYIQIYFVGTKSNCICLGILFTACARTTAARALAFAWCIESADNNNNNTVIIPKHLIRCRGLYLSQISNKNVACPKENVDRGDIFDLQLPHFGCDGARLLGEEKWTKNRNGGTGIKKRERAKKKNSGKNDKTSRRWSDIEKKKSNKIDGVAFQLQKKVTVSLIPMRQCLPARSNKSEPVRISKIIV